MKSALVLVVCLIVVTSTSAQTNPEYLKTKSLQFSFNGLNLGTINAGVGGKVWTSDVTAVVVSIGGNYSYDKSDPNPRQTGTTSIFTTLQVQLAIEWHAAQSDNFSPYLVGGIFGRYERRRTEYSYPSNTDEFISREMNVGISFGVGAEYWITKRLTLSGQHLFQVSYAFGSQENNSTSNLTTTSSSQTTRGANLGFGTSSLVLSLYF